MADIGISVEVFADLHQQVKGMHSRMKEHYEYSRPIYKTVQGSITVPTGFTTPLVFTAEGSPAQGRMWNIRWAGIFMTDAHTQNSTANADIYAGTPSVPGTPSPIIDLIHGFYSIPGDIGAFTKDVFWCQPGGQIYAAVYGSGVAVGQVYILAARVAEHKLYDVNARMIP